MNLTPSEITWSNAHVSGCTANVVLVTPTHIYCASAGDARSVLSDNGIAVELSIDHKLDIPKEQNRVLAAGL